MERNRAETRPIGIDGDGAGLDHLPERLRRVQRFGDVQVAALAEAEALRREIDALAARLARAEAGKAEAGKAEAGKVAPGHRNQEQTLGGQEDVRQCPDVTPGTMAGAADEFPVAALIPASDSLRAWLALRRAGLAIGDAIARLATPRNAAAD